jgi:hypothetical protein
MNINSIPISNAKLIAPCGMNCGVCMAYLREKNKCPGCRGNNENKSISCVRCIIKNCRILKQNKLGFCSEKCKKYPCIRLRNLDKRYRTKYNMSMIENLENIKTKGIKKFLKNQKIKYTCSKCNGTICVHRSFCINCGAKR